MKLKYTTKLFIVVNLIVLTFRTLQIILLTESNTAFLIDGFWPKAFDIAGSVLVVLSLTALFSNSAQAVRQPVRINCKGVPSVVVSAITGVAFLIVGLVSYKTLLHGNAVVLTLALLSMVGCVLMAVSAITGKPFFKAVALPFIGYWLAEFVLSYLYYTEHPLRVRTVYEVFAVIFTVLFFVTFGKAVSGVKSEKSFRRIYPLGLTASALCMASVVPETLAKIFGHSDKVAESAVMPLALIAAALFTGFFTINTFKKSNTIHPNRKKRSSKRKTWDSSIPTDSISSDETTV